MPSVGLGIFSYCNACSFGLLNHIRSSATSRKCHYQIWLEIVQHALIPNRAGSAAMRVPIGADRHTFHIVHSCPTTSEKIRAGRATLDDGDDRLASMDISEHADDVVPFIAAVIVSAAADQDAKAHKSRRAFNMNQLCHELQFGNTSNWQRIVGLLKHPLPDLMLPRLLQRLNGFQMLNDRHVGPVHQNFFRPTSRECKNVEILDTLDFMLGDLRCRIDLLESREIQAHICPLRV